MLVQLDQWKIPRRLRTRRPFPPKKLIEEVPLHLAKIGVKLTTLTAKQAMYLVVPVAGPYKPTHYRY